MANDVHDAARLRELQALPLDRKILITQTRIIEWYTRNKGQVYVSYSGGKDSTVLLHIIRNMGFSAEQIPAVFSNTGLEYAEIQNFARQNGADFVHPKMRFDEVISTYGYPIISKEVAESIYYARRIRNSNNASDCLAPRKHSELTGQRAREGGKTLSDNGGVSLEEINNTPVKEIPNGQSKNRYRKRLNNGKLLDKERNDGKKSQFNIEKYLPACQELPFNITHRCCAIMKKYPLKVYKRQTYRYPIIAMMAEESRVRKQSWIRNGCNAFDSTDPKSTPMAFWTEQDVLQYIVKYNVPICSVYGDVIEKDGKLSCTGCHRTGCVYCGFGAHNKSDNRFLELQRIAPRQFEYAFGGGQWVDNPAYDATAPKYDGDWLNWNPKKIWVPSKEGLGLKYVIDSFNELYPKNKIKY